MIKDGVVIKDYLYDLQSHIEIHFEYSKSNCLFVDTPLSSFDCLEYLDNQIIKKPNKLLSHIRKIRVLQIREGRSAQLFAALVDMFEVMQKNGLAIKERILNESKPLLSKLQFGYLQSVLSSGEVVHSSNDDQMETLQICRSIPGLSFIHAKTDETKSYLLNSQNELNNLAELIDGYIESSQIDLALDTLEVSMEHSNFTTEMGELLMSLYKSSDNKLRFENILNSQNKKSQSLPAYWYETELFFKQLQG